MTIRRAGIFVRLVQSALLLLVPALTALPSFAMSADAYQAERDKDQPITLGANDRYADFIKAHPGEVLELQGNVTGIFSDIDSSGYLLRLKDGESALLITRQTDTDLAVGVTLSALARVPAAGTILDTLALTPLGPPPAATQWSPGTGTGATSGATTAADTGNNADPALTQNVKPMTFTVPAASAPKVTPSYPAYTPPADPAPVPEDLPFYKRPDVLQAYTDKIQEYNPYLDSDAALHIAAEILKASDRYGIDPRLVFSIVRYESCFDTRSVSGCGATGLGQLMPDTAIGLGVYDCYDVSENLDGTAHYLWYQLQRFGHVKLAIAAYNAGPGAVDKYGGIPPYDETQNYVRRVWGFYCELASLDPDGSDAIGN